jgi:hypothetical protein
MPYCWASLAACCQHVFAIFRVVQIFRLDVLSKISSDWLLLLLLFQRDAGAESVFLLKNVSCCLLVGFSAHLFDGSALLFILFILFI